MPPRPMRLLLRCRRPRAPRRPPRARNASDCHACRMTSLPLTNTHTHTHTHPHTPTHTRVGATRRHGGREGGARHAGRATPGVARQGARDTHEGVVPARLAQRSHRGKGDSGGVEDRRVDNTATQRVGRPLIAVVPALPAARANGPTKCYARWRLRRRAARGGAARTGRRGRP